MRQTTERHDPSRVRTVEDLVIHLMHVYAYSLIRDYARPEHRVLEVGFGEGYGSALIRDFVREYHGVEVCQDAVEHASERYAHEKCTFHHSSNGLPFHDHLFDLVFSFQVIEHVEDVKTFLHEIHRVCRPGGAILIVTPNRNHRLDDGERPWNRYHVREFSPGELEDALKREMPRVELFGIHGTPLIDQIERARVGRARRLAKIDRFGLRYALPEGIDTALRAFLKRNAQTTTLEEAPSFALSDLRHSQARVESGLDLLAVAQA